MTPAALALAAWERRLLARLDALADRVDAGDQTAWSDALATLPVLVALIPPERRPLETTAAVAARFGVSPKTIRTKAGRLGLERVRMGKAGRAAIRWRSA